MSTATRTFDVTGMTCDHCKNAVNTELTDLASVTDVSVDVEQGTVAVQGAATDDEITQAIERAGYEVTGKR